MAKTSAPRIGDIPDERPSAPPRADRRATRFASGDAECAAWHYGPGTSTACVVMAHGLGAIKEVGLDRFARRLSATGHDVVAFDYRGFGESTGGPRQVVDIAAQQEDWRAAIAFARRLSGVERIVLWGTSYAGGHVLALGAELDGLAGVIAQAPMADGRAAIRGVGPRQLLRLVAHGLIDEARGRLGLPPHTIAITGEPGELALLTTPDAAAGVAILNPDGHPWPNEVGARIALRAGSYRPGRHAERIACPLLVVVCDDDVITPPGPATDAARRAPRGELLRVPGGHYAVYQGAGFDHSITAQIAFLERCVATGPSLGAPTDRERA